MNDNDRLIRDPAGIAGYTYGTAAAARSPLTLADLELHKAARS